MVLYCFLKAISGQEENFIFRKKIIPIFSLGSLLAGIFLISNVIYPIISYRVETAFLRRKLLSPVAGFDVNQGRMPGIVLGFDERLDYTRASNWYPSAPALPAKLTKITHYTFSIPKLGIKEASVQIGGEDLMTSVIQYPGKALP